ncbi:hypothetical protein TWF281_004834 [Arthrobotrys megalospora]
MGNAIDRAPYELWLDMYSNLSVMDLKALSLCSRAHRERVIPSLYPHLRLSEASLVAFDKGIFSHLKDKVCEVTFGGLQNGCGLRETVRLVALYCRSLGMFPKLTGIHVPYCTTMYYEAEIPRAIILKLSPYPFYQNLRKFCLDATLINLESSQYQYWETSTNQLSGEEAEFFACNGNKEFKFPTTLEVASGFSFEESPQGGLMSLTLQHLTRAGLGISQYIYFYPAFFYHCSASTLKSLKLTMSCSNVLDYDKT